MENQTIRFNTNWNNKLNCKSFSTVRLSSPNKYKVDEIYNILLVDKSGKAIKNLGFAKLLSINEFLLNNITPAMCLLDTNYNKPEFHSNVQNHVLKLQDRFHQKEINVLGPAIHIKSSTALTSN
jgi:hypothetical protein